MNWKNRETELLGKLVKRQSPLARLGGMESEITKKRQIVQCLSELAADAGRLDLAREAFQLTNSRLFLQFQQVQGKKRRLDSLVGCQAGETCLTPRNYQ